MGNHRFVIRRLQSEVADTLYHRTRNYYDGFIEDLQYRVDQWREAALAMAGDDQNAIDWFLHQYHHLITFLHRPSPANLQPSSYNFRRCFESSSSVIRLYGEMNVRGTIDCTWMAVHWLFLASMTNLFCLWVDNDIRRGVDWFEVNEDIHTASIVLTSMAEKWNSARGCLDVYSACALGTLRKYSFKIGSPEENIETNSFESMETIPLGIEPLQDSIMHEASIEQLFPEVQLDMFSSGTPANPLMYNFD
jgi:hypothetical protein